MGVARRAREFKHAAWLRKKRVAWAASEVDNWVRDRVHVTRSRLAAPRYDDGDFPDSFLSERPKTSTEVVTDLPRRIFCLWTGDNPLTTNRTEALDQLRRDNPHLEVVLVTVDNLTTWIRPEAPLPEAYWHLSLVHRSDFLRSYLMHHHGGGYADIKRDYGDLAPCFDRLEQDGGAWLLGYPERSARDVSDEPGSVYASLKRHHRSLPANGAFLARPGTPLTAEWFGEVSRRLDGFSPRLALAPGNVLGDNPGYPVPWGALQGATFQPVCLKYLDRVVVDERLRPSLSDYR